MSKETAIVYVRVSTRDQKEGESIPTQKAECSKYLGNKGFKLAHPIFEEARSGFLPGKRVAYYDMLEYIEKSRPQHLIFLLHDRLSRDPGQFEDLVRLCSEIDHSLILHDIYRHRVFGILDDEAYEELAELRKAIINSGLESAKMRYRVGKSIKRLLEKGIYPGYAPAGYRNVVGTGRIIVDEERAPLVIRTFNLFATGDFSLDDIFERMQRYGVSLKILFTTGSLNGETSFGITEGLRRRTNLPILS
jgi:site-specific DNA recombinase